MINTLEYQKSYPYVRTDIDDIRQALQLLKLRKLQRKMRQKYENEFLQARKSKREINESKIYDNNQTHTQNRIRNYASLNQPSFKNTNKTPLLQKTTSIKKSHLNPLPFIPKQFKQNQAIDKLDTQRKNQQLPPLKKNIKVKKTNLKTTQKQKPFEQQSIKDINKKNQIKIVKYSDSQLILCGVCARKFNPQSIQRHEKNCEKVFQNKRKKYNAADHRMVDGQHKNIVKQSLPETEKGTKKKMAKWKAQSLAFRALLKQNRNEVVDPKEMALIKQAQSSSVMKCPHCERKFSQKAGPRHIEFCGKQVKKVKRNVVKIKLYK